MLFNLLRHVRLANLQEVAEPFANLRWSPGADEKPVRKPVLLGLRFPVFRFRVRQVVRGWAALAGCQVDEVHCHRQPRFLFSSKLNIAAIMCVS